MPVKSWIAYIVGCAFNGFLAFLPVFGANWIGLFWFDDEKAFWSFSLGWSLGVALVPPSAVAAYTLQRLYLMPKAGVPFLDAKALGQLELMRRDGWLRGTPVADMHPYMFLLDWNSVALDSRRRKGIAAAFVLDRVLLLFAGIICIWIGWEICHAHTFFSTALGTAGMFHIFAALLELVPFRTKDGISRSTQSVRMWLDPDQLTREIDRVAAFQLETVTDWNPGVRHEGIDRLFERPMSAGIETPEMAATTLAGIHGSYLTALGANDFERLEQLSHLLDSLIKSGQVDKHVTPSANLLLAFHYAYVRNAWSDAERLLEIVKSDRAMRKGPLYLLAAGLTKLGKGDTAHATSILAEAEQKWAKHRFDSGATLMWLALTRSVLQVIPPGILKSPVSVGLAD